MLKKVVSANYRNRKATNRWLVRDRSQEPHQAVEVACVVATNVAFCPSTKDEVGFGCNVVAFCEKVEEETEDRSGEALEQQGFVRIRFNVLLEFYHDEHDPVHLEGCKRLVLRHDGTMYAML